MRVLIADDHDVLRRGVRLLVSGLNIEVCGEAGDGHDAVAKARELKPDVVIMDLVMPGQDGLQATRQIRRLLPRTQVVFLSQHDIPQVRNEALKAGAASYVTKSSIWKLVLFLKNVQLSGASLPLEHFGPAPGLAHLFPIESGVVGTGLSSANGQQATAFTNPNSMAPQDLELITKLAPTGMTCCTSDLRYLWANHEYAKFLQKPLDKIVGRKILDVLGKEAFQLLSPHFEQVLRGQRVSYETDVVLERIGPRRIAVSYRPTLDDRGVPDGWFAFVRDITKKK